MRVQRRPLVVIRLRIIEKIVFLAKTKFVLRFNAEGNQPNTGLLVGGIQIEGILEFRSCFGLNSCGAQHPRRTACRSARAASSFTAVSIATSASAVLPSRKYTFASPIQSSGSSGKHSRFSGTPAPLPQDALTTLECAHARPAHPYRSAREISRSTMRNAEAQSCASAYMRISFCQLGVCELPEEGKTARSAPMIRTKISLAGRV